MLNVKFWFVIATQINLSIDRRISRVGCKILEFILKICLHTDSWYNACVAMERAVNVSKGIHFKKRKSIVYAKRIIFLLPTIIGLTFLYEPMKRDLTDDGESKWVLCIIEYSRETHVYSSFIQFLHMLGPFLVNLFSAIYIMIQSGLQREKVQTAIHRRKHFLKQFQIHKHLIYSSLILVTLSIPRLIISLVAGCMKTTGNPWPYTIGYFISFIPAVIMFFIFILPSRLYRNQIQQTSEHLQRKICRRFQSIKL